MGQFLKPKWTYFGGRTSPSQMTEMLFLGEPSISLSEYTRYTRLFDAESYIRTTRIFLKRMLVFSVNTSSLFPIPERKLSWPVWRQATEASLVSSARPIAPEIPPFLARLRKHVAPLTFGSSNARTTILWSGPINLNAVFTSPISRALAIPEKNAKAYAVNAKSFS